MELGTAESSIGSEERKSRPQFYPRPGKDPLGPVVLGGYVPLLRFPKASRMKPQMIILS